MSGAGSKPRLNLSRVNGPHSPERTDAAARVIPEAVRFLNYATLPSAGAPGISYAGDVDAVLGSLQAAAAGLDQTVRQLSECLREDLATGRLRLARGHSFDSDDPELAVRIACAQLEVPIAGSLEVLSRTLGEVRKITSAMYLESRP